MFGGWTGRDEMNSIFLAGFTDKAGRLGVKLAEVGPICLQHVRACDYFQELWHIS